MSERRAWAALVREIGTAESFKAEPYRALLNQGGHMLTGALAAQAVFFVSYDISGVVWGKAVLLTLALLPGLILEARQGWNGKDTLADLWFRLLGVALIYLPLTEGDMGGLEPEPRAFYAVAAVAAVSMLLHLRPRVLRKYGANQRHVTQRGY